VNAEKLHLIDKDPRVINLIKISIPFLIIFSLPLAIIFFLPVDSTYFDSLKGIFSFSAQLFAFGPLDDIATAAYKGNWLAILTGNLLPVIILSVIIYRICYRQDVSNIFSFLISTLWGISVVAIIGVLLISRLSVLIMDVRQ
jgi:FtsH-binding integral membrane protein